MFMFSICTSSKEQKIGHTNVGMHKHTGSLRSVQTDKSTRTYLNVKGQTHILHGTAEASANVPVRRQFQKQCVLFLQLLFMYMSGCVRVRVCMCACKKVSMFVCVDVRLCVGVHLCVGVRL